MRAATEATAAATEATAAATEATAAETGTHNPITRHELYWYLHTPVAIGSVIIIILNLTAIIS
jgi:hypothetical protein